MAASDLDAWMVGGNQRKGDAEVLAAAQDVLAVDETEGETDQRRLRPQRNVALLPGEADPDDVLALVLAAHQVADVAHGGRVGARRGTGEREAGNLQPFGQARQVVLLLLGGA